MAFLDVRGLTKTIGARVLFEQIDFSLADGEHVGLIGANGSGKTTLLRILAGDEPRNEGEISLRRNARVAYLPQEPELPPGASIFEAAAAGKPELVDVVSKYHSAAAALAREAAVADSAVARNVTRLSAEMDRLGAWAYEHRVEEMLTRVGVAGWDRDVDSLSGGERKRVALARTLLAEPDLLLLDEPTNHLDADTIQWLEEWLVDFPGVLLLVTHDRYFLDRVVDRNVEIALGALHFYDGGYADYLEQKEDRERRIAVEDEKRRRLIEKELEWAKRAPPARTGKARARLRRAEGLQRERRELAERQRDERTVIETAAGPRLGRTAIELRDVHKAWDGRRLVDGFSSLLRPGQRIGVIGPNGAGKTTLLRMIAGEESPDAGEIVRRETARIAYHDQRRDSLDPEKTVYETVAVSEWLDVGGRRVHARSYLEQFLFPTATHQQKVSALSGGERNRLLLARLFLEEANVLLLDEPTNDLDLVTLQVLEEALLDFDGVVIVVTHDRFFLDKLATHLWVFEGDGAVREHVGGYDLYARLRAEAIAEKEAAERERAEAERRRRRVVEAARRAESRPERRLSWTERQELEAIEERILDAESERDRLEAILADPALYAADNRDPAAITRAYHAAGERVDALYRRWAELDEKS